MCTCECSYDVCMYMHRGDDVWRVAQLYFLLVKNINLNSGHFYPPEIKTMCFSLGPVPLPILPC